MIDDPVDYTRMNRPDLPVDPTERALNLFLRELWHLTYGFLTVFVRKADVRSVCLGAN